MAPGVEQPRVQWTAGVSVRPGAAGQQPWKHAAENIDTALDHLKGPQMGFSVSSKVRKYARRLSEVDSEAQRDRNAVYA